MSQHNTNLTIALAGLFQATGLVRDVAQTGHCDPLAFETSIASIFKIDSTDCEDVFGNLHHLEPGLRTLIQQLNRPQEMDITRYVLSLLALERKLRNKPALLDRIGEGIEQAAKAMSHFATANESIIARLAELYASTVSTLKPRIMVNGSYQHLGQADNANRIRALLLAGIRSAVLWRQQGGRRLTLLTRRKALLLEARQLLSGLDTEATADA